MDEKHRNLYNAITEFSNKYGCHKFNNDENHREYMQLVDMCVDVGLDIVSVKPLYKKATKRTETGINYI